MYNDFELLGTIWDELSEECREFLTKAFAGSKHTEEFKALFESND